MELNATVSSIEYSSIKNTSSFITSATFLSDGLAQSSLDLYSLSKSSMLCNVVALTLVLGTSIENVTDLV